ncbi:MULTISPECIES: HNH endonuclease signature motif containing protein [Enterobacter]|uniref:HNH endonuclease signature motif containing protein n=1 Tax=Enterobacter TaxID=547 RepID=UPI002365F17B|nr:MULTISPECIES: HNH endonuclease signature motif containing protein [Enterobacter]MDW3571622.1 HNH endonuclease [Enterobacter asburiae]MDZ5639417.1 HNH endonuclease signature motif containing protein [Enterobacter sp. A103]WIK24579.1 HNH endonuclease [Enterobacter asburiae]
MIIREHNGYKHVISRANYTRRVWKANHYAFGNWTPGCWNTVHCGPRDSTYMLAHSQATVAACEIMKISRAEFQFFFEKTDQGDASVHIEQHDVRFNWKGKTYTFTRGMDKSKVIATLKQLELYGNADADRKIAKINKQKAESEALQAKRAAAVARTAKLMRKDTTLTEEKITSVSAKNLPQMLYPKYPLEIAQGLPHMRVLSYRRWVGMNHKKLNRIPEKERIALFLATASLTEDELLAVAQMFAPMPEFLLLATPKLVLLVPESDPKLELENELEYTKPFYNKIYGADPVEGVSDTTKAVLVTETAPDVVISSPKEEEPSQSKQRISGVRKPRKSRIRQLVERDAKGDIPFYGMRRRTQAQFRVDVALNCFERCVISGASLMRCEAAHLLAHARKGGASFKNGLLLRADLHTLFDAGMCAIDPLAMTIHFSLTILESDPDLAAYEGKTIKTVKPINSTNLDERWTIFLTAYMEVDTAA